jgi:uncharacterized protein (TIGR02453 family)
MTRTSHGPHFTPRLFAFLRELSRNNDRAWFTANKPRYERDVRDPMLRFIADFAPHLRRISPHFVADPRPVGGSMFRIYRDSRFSRDKRPYKTVASAQFRHALGKDVHAPGFYLHLEPGNVFGAVGMWRPEAEPLRLVREAIVEKPAAWKRAIGGQAFRERFELDGDTLRRAPRGFDPEHPLIEDLKRKDFVAGAPFEDAEVFEPDFLERYAATARAGAPFMAFLARAVGVPW